MIEGLSKGKLEENLFSFFKHKNNRTLVYFYLYLIYNNILRKQKKKKNMGDDYKEYI